MITAMNTTPQPGWYPDPSGSGDERYWDGSSWGQDTRPPQAAAGGYQQQQSAAPYSQPSADGGYGQPAGGYGQPSGAYGPGGYGPAGGGYVSAAGYGSMPGEAVAAWGWRLLSYLIDILILVIPIGLVSGLLTGGDIASNEFLSGAVGVVCWAIYRTALVGTRGATLGQSLLGMRVAEIDNQGANPPSWNTAAIRGIAAPILFAIPLVGLVNGLMPLFTKENQALHDMIAKTVVLKRR